MIVALLTVDNALEKGWRVETVDIADKRAYGVNHSVVLNKPEALELVRAIIDCFTQKETKHG